MTPSPWTSGLPPHLNTATRPSPGWCCPGGSCKSISDLQNLLIVGGASASVDGYRTIMNLAHENHRDEQGKLSCARVPMEVMSTMLAGMPTRENTFVTCSRTRSPCVRSRQQIGHLLVRVIEDRELDASISRQLMVPTTMPTLAGSPSITDSRSSKPTNFGSLCEPSSRIKVGMKL
ncbi:hypothetical protein PR202_ga31264 [Eleusine coracana subsp. coracana]|uniref:Uncharacterized protein n=1 Tax=Eleusine coracana subsp. coracana TaxID=191504 RepID=A0AAV5DRG6_ELECO|nr:hypothetical protein PR202_ga31264 [Eleusine coracana subsp. coracana]